MSIIYKKEIHIEKDVVEIEVPHDFLGKDFEVVFKEKKKKNDDNELEDFFSQFDYDLSHLDFKRDELYER